MKKQLLRVLSLAAGVLTITACSSEYDFESKYNTESERDKVFNEIFVETFGEPDAYHTWGFERPELSETRSAYPNANQWASQGYNVPDPLTAGQKARVQYYFQMIQNPGGTKDYGQIDFFMQQVYDGGTDPMDGKSPEVYKAADNQTVIESGEHMDHLTAGSDNEHVYNFNNGTCSTNPNVGDNGAALDTEQHSDEIMLMLNTKTDCFGYANSDASYVRTDRYRQVEGSVIDAYCDNNSAFQDWLTARGITDDKVVDKWNRSFIGFDFDMIPDESCYTGNDVWVDKENPNYTGEKEYAGKTYTEYDYYRYDLYGEKYHYLIAEQNQYCGEFQTHDPEPDEVTAKELLDNGWLPVSNSSNKKWVKIGGCADGYYSDWIVSFMPATGTTITKEIYARRVIAEDLGTAEATDFDYNDVVFDVVWDDAEGTGTTITLKAAGGTLPLWLVIFDENATNIPSDYNAESDPRGIISWKKEVHEWFDEGTTDKTITTQTMVNTGLVEGTAAPEHFGKAIYADQVRIFVYKEGWYEITAPTGKPAQKLATGTDFKWLGERVPITGQTYYGNFLEYIHKADIWGENSYKLWYTRDPQAASEEYKNEHEGTIGL